MRAGRRLAATVAAVLAFGSLISAGPAHAFNFNLDAEITDYRWSPRTGNVAVVVEAQCPRRAWRADVAIELAQKRVTARDRREVRCDGELHTITLRLDPKRGRFHPGSADALYTTGMCFSDVCGYLEQSLPDVRIPPPGRARGVR